MCKFCESIWGKKCLPHTEAECALKQAAYCPLCGKGQHFQDDCPKQARRKMAPHVPVIPSVAVPEQPATYIMSGRSEEYAEYYKRLMKQKIKAETEEEPCSRGRKLKEGEMERLVREELAAQGMKVLTTPLAIKKNLTAAEAPCGLEHPLNKECCAKK
jgi:hypothetical protein